MVNVFSFHEAKRAVNAFVSRMRGYHKDSTIMDSHPLNLLQMMVLPRQFFKEEDPEIEVTIGYVVTVCSLLVKAYLREPKQVGRTVLIGEENQITKDWKPMISYSVKVPTKEQARAAATVAGYFAFMKLFYEERIDVDTVMGKSTLSETVKGHKHFWAIESFDPLETLTLGEFLSLQSEM